MDSPVRAIVVTRGFRGRLDNLSFVEIANRIIESENTFKQKQKPFVAYDAIVEVARDSVQNIAESLRIHHGLEESLADVAIGRFDLYEALLADVVGKKKLKQEARVLFWDIVAYVLVNQLLFYKIVQKISPEHLPELPDPHPLETNRELPLEVKNCFDQAAKYYNPIFASNSIDVLLEASDLRVNQAIARLIFAIRRLEPENVDVDLLGRLYHDTIPPATRKRMGAFYTNPKAAELLATMAVKKWNATVLDPACGSGTLLVSAYKRKKALFELETKKKATPNMHVQFLRDQIYGIDAMKFASHMAATNLLLQMGNVVVDKINVFSANSLDEMTKKSKDHQTVPDNYFDLTIMNPPFTFWRRLPKDERTKLERTFGTSSMNYWGYFLLAAMPKLRENGTIAAVLPDDFLRGKGAASVREPLFTDDSYSLKAIVKSKVEVAFSESSKFRDYLVFIQKTKPKAETRVTTVLVKKPVNELSTNDIIELANNLEDSDLTKLQTDSFYAYDYSHSIVKKFIHNLHPLVAFVEPELREIWLRFQEFLESSGFFITLGELEKAGKVRVRIYRPGQYKQYNLAPRDIRSKIPEIARNLFATKYKAGGKWLFRIDNEQEQKVHFSVRNSKLGFYVPREKLLPSLRTYSSVKSINITDNTEFIIKQPNSIPSEIRKILVWNEDATLFASKDIEEAYSDLSGNCVLLMKPQIPSPNLFWFCYYSDKPVLSTNDYVLKTVGLEEEYKKILALFINSTPGILQIFALRPEIRGAWSRLDKESVWNYLYIPNPELIKSFQTKQLVLTFEKFSKKGGAPLQDRFHCSDSVQAAMDDAVVKAFNFKEIFDKRQLISKLLDAELQNLLDVMSHSKNSGSSSAR